MQNTADTTKKFLSSIMDDFTNLDDMEYNIRRCEHSLREIDRVINFFDNDVEGDECEITGPLYVDLVALSKTLEEDLEVLHRGASMIDPDVYDEG